MVIAGCVLVVVWFVFVILRLAVLWFNDVDLVISFLTVCGWFNGYYGYGCCIYV